ncbi:MAG TPA: glutamine--fructose-6-phosphate transaminase (isomerizing) [Burkholderiales bacterium]|nr:glutamine--fructose-6-phosphate transaminase (isomerizing) [Burkholderiales bacterium]
MCGIVGAVAQRNVVPILLEGLGRLEYRDYDSAGVAVINGTLQRLRSAGRVENLVQLTAERGLMGNIGIAHTRRAILGTPSERNAHPHVSGSVSVVHNGIIENHEEVRRKLMAKGYKFESETDTEVIVHLVHSHLSTRRGLLDAVRRSVKELVGSYAIVVIAAADPVRLVVARAGAPLLLGLGDGENFTASDTSALLQITQRIIQLEEGDCAQVGLTGVHIVDAKGNVVERPLQVSRPARKSIALGSYSHFMQKEIFEQPAAIESALNTAINAHRVSPNVFGPAAGPAFANVDAALILACGTSYHAGMVGRYWLECLAGLPATVEIASEYRYRKPVSNPRALVIVISQSGETADTLAALHHARSLGHRYILSICNVPESALMRASELGFLTHAGPEIGVASTKTFTTQLATLLLLAIVLARLRNRISVEREEELLDALRNLPAAVYGALGSEPQIRTWAETFTQCEHVLFIARGIHYPIAMEGAFKLKEVSHIHAEAYTAGKLKHGPLALADTHVPVVAIAPNDELLDELKSNLQEVRARGAELHILGDQTTRFSDSDEGMHVIRICEHTAVLSPIVHAIPLQLLAYHAALLRGNNVDKPGNLTKSVP